MSMKNISIICANEHSALETVALRGALEYLGYTVTAHWVGSVDQFKQLLTGQIPLAETVLLSCHGYEEGFYGTDNVKIPLNELNINLPGATVLSLGCSTGTEAHARAFMKGRANNYLAPPSDPEGNSALMFALMFFWQLNEGRDIVKSRTKASAILKNPDDRFHLYENKKGKMLVDGSREIPL